MKQAELRERIAQLNVWSRGSQRAPHKPLLLLYALARCARGEGREIPYAQIDIDLTGLLREFGPPRWSHHPEYPFWHLQTDGLWELTETDGLEFRKSASSPKKSALLGRNVRGGLPASVFSLLARNPALRAEVARELLESHFPDSLHQDILQAVGLDLSAAKTVAPRRDPKFREAVLRAYSYACAVCGFDVRLGSQLVALEAAHIQWRQAGGPDTQPNGLALCSLHHKLFDFGAFSLRDDRTVMLSEYATGGRGFSEHLLTYHSKRARSPQNPNYHPGPRFLSWHRREVFRSPERFLGEAAC